MGKFEVRCNDCGKEYQQPTHSLLAYGMKMPSCLHCGSNNIRMWPIVNKTEQQTKKELVVT